MPPTPADRTTVSLLDRAFAAVYDPILQASEVRGLADMRRELLAPLTGEVVEIGAGTGLNLPHWPDAVTRVLACEPDPHMAQRLRPRADDPRVEVVLAPGEAIPAADDAIDAVVSTLVLCTVDDLERTVREVARVLRPGGTFALLEHVAAEDERLHRVQRVIEPAWRVGARGCRLTREPVAVLERHGFDVSGLVEDRLPGAAPVARRLVRGHAVLRDTT